jgi:hypothetical protein
MGTRHVRVGRIEEEPQLEGREEGATSMRNCVGHEVKETCSGERACELG